MRESEPVPRATSRRANHHLRVKEGIDDCSQLSRVRPVFSEQLFDVTARKLLIISRIAEGAGCGRDHYRLELEAAALDHHFSGRQSPIVTRPLDSLEK